MNNEAVTCKGTISMNKTNAITINNAALDIVSMLGSIYYRVWTRQFNGKIHEHRMNVRFLGLLLYTDAHEQGHAALTK